MRRAVTRGTNDRTLCRKPRAGHSIILAATLLVAAAISYRAIPVAAQSQIGPFTSHIEADLSDPLVSITLGFAGTELLLFGATDGAGDVIVIVRGPDSDVTVRRKDRVGGIWINRDHVTFPEAPGYYLVASTAPIDTIVPEDIRAELVIGLDHLPIVPREPLADDEFENFRQALLRNQQRLGLYGETPGSITFKADRLFRTEVLFPSNVPTGDYTVEVLLMRDGHVVGLTTTELAVDRRGFEALLFRFAHEHSAYYGIIAIVIALAAGWLAGVAFRRV